jgi:thiamine-monophosphate kinase
MVTGTLGRSASALEVLERGGMPDKHLLKNHLSPRSRLDVSRKIAPLANAMIDISDGLGADLTHICNRSRVSAEIRADDLPIHPKVLETANQLKLDPMTLALAGGEDFQLLFSVPEAHVAGIMDLGIDCRPIGTILPGSEPPTLLMHGGQRKPLPAGYDHFT